MPADTLGRSDGDYEFRSSCRQFSSTFNSMNSYVMKKTLKFLPLGLIAALAACSTSHNEKTSSNVTPLPAAGAPPAHQSSTSTMACSDATGGLVPMTVTMPKEAVFGEPFSYELNVSAAQCAGNVTVSDTVSQNAKFVSSEPPAEQDGARLRWVLGDMEKGQYATIRVTLKADKEGTLGSCASVSADPRTCSQVFIGKAALALLKSGPETALVGAQIVYAITVSNKGTLTARDVVVVDELPDGMQASIDQTRATLQVGDLAPNEAKTVSITVRGVKKGKFCNVVNAKSPNAGEAHAEFCTTFMQPAIELVKQGPREQFLSRSAQYRMIVSNTGDTPLTNVTLTDNGASGTTFASAEGGSINGNRAIWNIGTLQPGEHKTFTASLSGTAAGNLCNRATVTSAEGVTQTAEACTLWRGVSALLLETLDNPDPIQVGENTTYTVRVTNQGTADDTNIKMVVEFTAEIDPVSASNGGVINGKTVTFPPFPRLHAKEMFEYTIVGKGVRVGDARTKFTRTSDGIPAPTLSEESTRVF
jgi:uncharacterized repeat protein (TIGR01451 family)